MSRPPRRGVPEASLWYQGLRAARAANIPMPTRTRSKSSLPPLGVADVRFVAAGRNGRRTFVPHGFNYEWTIRDGRAVRLEDLLTGGTDRIAADFSAMRDLGANTVRVFLPTATFLRGPTEVDRGALRRLGALFRSAER